MATMQRLEFPAAGVWRALAGGLLAVMGGGLSPAHAALAHFTSEAAWLAVSGATQRIGFDDLPDGTPVSSAYAAVTFASFNGGVPVTAAESFPHSAANVLSVDDPLVGAGGGVSLIFADRHRAAGFWYSDAQFAGNSVTVYGKANEVLGRFELVFPHPTEWQFVGFVSPVLDIARIDIAMAGNDRVTLDDVQLSAVPEPGSWTLMLSGGLLVGALQRRRIRVADPGRRSALARLLAGGVSTMCGMVAGPARAAADSSVVYAVSSGGDLMWRSHLGHAEGSFRWADSAARKVGSGWNVQHVFAGDNGIVYAIRDNGDLIWNRHEGRTDGSARWAAPTGRKVGAGWNVRHAFSGGGGIIYTVTESGDLMWFRHTGHRDGSFQWLSDAGKKVGEGWNAKHVFCAGDGVIYAVMDNGDLMWFLHEGRRDGSFRWAQAAGRKVGDGWNVAQAFSSGDGVIYAQMDNGDLMWFRHEGQRDGSFRWAFASGRKVGIGWDGPAAFSGATLSL